MVASVYDFMANFDGGGARPNRYEVIFTFPQGIGSVKEAQKISFTCRSASIPASTMGQAPAHYKGREVKLPGDKTWDDWTVSIYLDTDFVGRKLFEKWHESLLGFQSNVSSSGWQSPIRGMATAQVNQLDREEKVVASYTVEGIWPTSIGEISLGYDNNDTIMEQSVTFAINGWRNNLE